MRLPDDWRLLEEAIRRRKPRRDAGGRMILVGTSVWIDHLRMPDLKLQNLLQNDEVVTHPFVRLELALGSIANRDKVLADLALLRQAKLVSCL